MEEDDGDALVDASSDMDQGPMEAEGEDALIATLSNADQGPEQNSTPAVHIGNRFGVCSPGRPKIFYGRPLQKRPYLRSSHDYQEKLEVINFYALHGMSSTLTRYYPKLVGNDHRNMSKKIRDWLKLRTQVEEVGYSSRSNLKKLRNVGVGTSLNHDTETIIVQWVQDMRNEGIPCYNADQNGVFYEYLPKRTINAGGVKTVWVPCGGKDKERSTAMLLGDSEGNKYALFIVLMQKKSTIATTLRANINDRNGFGVFPIGRDHIVEKATQMSVTINDVPRATTLSFGWYKRFLDRHSHLKVSKARVLSKPRNAVASNVVVDFFHELAHDLSLVNVDPSRIFNMGETNFSPTKTSKKVVVHRNTKAVYAEESSVPSHVTIVACVAADGTKVLPLFILPGEKVSTDTCDKLTIPGAALTTSEKGWTSSFICRKWLSMLDANIPASTMRPILLILDGCSSHYSEYIYPEATALNILLQFLPANATHLF
ncbi:hypothetical protein DYB35_005022 [Aphanomyces astaci]|uniref:DDE-1 domain-containing protein n=1 Tax=Aphanomyces astaci TaxID=112090 RepID=A0A418CLM7_APHAT|nr:hypothetical protein DYB35_005022 [Aphanomyces astaci]